MSSHPSNHAFICHPHEQDAGRRIIHVRLLARLYHRIVQVTPPSLRKQAT